MKEKNRQYLTMILVSAVVAVVVSVLFNVSGGISGAAVAAYDNPDFEELENAIFPLLQDIVQRVGALEEKVDALPISVPGGGGIFPERPQEKQCVCYCHEKTREEGAEDGDFGQTYGPFGPMPSGGKDCGAKDGVCESWCTSQMPPYGSGGGVEA